MNILNFLTDYIQLGSQRTGTHFTAYKIFNESKVICSFPHYIHFKLMSLLISVYTCSFGELKKNYSMHFPQEQRLHFIINLCP